MFEPTSRYATIETATLKTAGGDLIAYKRRRFPPRGEDLRLLVEATVAEGDRLDLIAARILGDPEQFWRIVDANDALNPFDLEQPGDTLRVPIPEAGG